MAVIPPRVLIVSRRFVRKNKFVDYVGEYHLDLILRYGAVPVIVPRVAGIEALLDTFEPFHGLLLCEGEDIHPSLYQHNNTTTAALTADQLDDIRRYHASDTAIDHEKDSIELRLANLCLQRNIPCMGICRGSQMLNVACGGTLYQDVESEVGGGVVHMNYENYDGHRHPVRAVAGTPMERWFEESLVGGSEVLVSSYHHQGVRRLADRFVGMAYSEDGLVEGFYDGENYDPEEGKFVVGLQFHPERMRRSVQGCEEFDYPGCAKPYEEFVKAVIAYQKKLNNSCSKPDSRIMEQQKENKLKFFLKSFSIPKNLFNGDFGSPLQPNGLEFVAEFPKPNTGLSLQQEKTLKQMGASPRNGSLYFQKLKMIKEKEQVVRDVMGKMSMEQLSELLSFYHKMSKICNEVLEMKLQTV